MIEAGAILLYIPPGGFPVLLKVPADSILFFGTMGLKTVTGGCLSLCFLSSVLEKCP